jgi:hypothetical protein
LGFNGQLSGRCHTQNPASFGDTYQANGAAGKNGIPDILDEVRWGLDWLVKMNPDSGQMYNQIADDRDHQGFRLPNKDTATYGKGLERPVYFCTGKPQGVFGHKSRATGIASTAGKYASAFALGSLVMQKQEYLEKAAYFGRQEKVTPWMGADTARHYQWYPFFNMGHWCVARSALYLLAMSMRTGMK